MQNGLEKEKIHWIIEYNWCSDLSWGVSFYVTIAVLSSGESAVLEAEQQDTTTKESKRGEKKPHGEGDSMAAVLS